MKKNFLNYLPSQSGFTLIEFLIVTAILGVIGTVVLSVLFTTFRVTGKADGLVEIRQSGNALVSQVTRSVRFAKSLDDPDSCIGGVGASSITVTAIESEEQITYSCDVAPTGGKITANGASLIDETRFSISNCSFSCTQNTVNEPPTVSLNFKLNLLNDASLAENQASMSFDASVTLRNYNN